MRVVGVVLAIAACAIQILAQQPPKEWIDPPRYIQFEVRIFF